MLVNTKNRIGNEYYAVRKDFLRTKDREKRFEKYGEWMKKTGRNPTNEDGSIRIFDDEERLLQLFNREWIAVDSVKVWWDLIECIENKDAELVYFTAWDIENKVYLSHLKTIHKKLKPILWRGRMKWYISRDDYVLWRLDHQDIVLIRAITSF